MSARKTERLLNLVICLLATRRYLTVSQVHRAVAGYGDGEPGDEAFRRMFERDKEELRELGIPLETGPIGVWEDEVGYRIARRDYELPEITLEPDEAAALGVAARLWQSATLAAAASSALLKLRAAGVDVDSAGLVALEPRVDATEPAFEACLAATRARTPVRFGYRPPGAGEPATRFVEPWGVVSWHGHWYLVGHDRDREASRVFRLSRIVGDVAANGAVGEVVPPAEVDLVAAVRAVEPRQPDQTATVRVRRGRGIELRRAAAQARSHDGDWDELDIVFSDADRLAEQVVGYGADVVVLDPEPVRAGVVERLRAAAEARS